MNGVTHTLSEEREEVARVLLGLSGEGVDLRLLKTDL